MTRAQPSPLSVSLSASLAALRELRARVVTGLSYGADLVLPPVCIACHEPADRHNSLCPHCWSEVRFIRPPLCERLGLPLPFAAGDQPVSAQALAHPPAYDRARAAAAYSGVVRDLIHNFKYGDHHEALPLFAYWLQQAGRELITEADLFVPVPLHYRRLWRRRFNQSAVLARWLAGKHAKPVSYQALRRVRATAHQVGLTMEERRDNVAGAFAVPPTRRGEIAGRRVLLIDDVITTGATVEACTLALREAGAAAVDVLALARVVDPEAPSV